MKEIISDFTEAQGLDAPLKACACCGLRNLDSSSTTRSYREVDIADINVQNMCRRREYGGVQCVLKVVVPRTRPHTGREVSRVKDK